MTRAAGVALGVALSATVLWLAYRRWAAVALDAL